MESDEATVLSPEEAFSVLGEETRLQTLQALGEAGRPLAFSELLDRIEYEDASNFNYHLKQLVGHFVQGGDDGYELRQAGHRVVEAVLSGAVTEAPVLERTGIDRPCQHCGADGVEIEYAEEQVGMYCTECSGQYGGTSDGEVEGDGEGEWEGDGDGEGEWEDDGDGEGEWEGDGDGEGEWEGDGDGEGEWEGEALPEDRQRIGYLHLPPAGLDGRAPEEVFEAAFRWTVMQAQTLHRGVCPRCSAAVDETVTACEDHDATDGICGSCERRFAVAVHSECTNCTFELGGSAIGHLHTSPALRRFLLDHGVDPLSSPFPSTLEVASVEEELLGTDPVRARFGFDVDGDELVLTVDDALSVADATRNQGPDDDT